MKKIIYTRLFFFVFAFTSHGCQKSVELEGQGVGVVGFAEGKMNFKLANEEYQQLRPLDLSEPSLYRVMNMILTRP